jgi:phage recombination protein Bet
METFGIDDEKVELIKKTVAENATPDELKLFLYQASRTGLDPLARQIYFQKRYNKRRNKYEMTVITGIDGYRLVADRTGQYAGNDDPVFDSEDSPRKATVTVYKIIGNVRCPFTASARWDQYYPGDEQGFMWRKMPHLMLGKCAEALALRKAFPAELSGLYIKEEMDQADAEQAAPYAAPAPQSAPAPADLYTGSEAQRNVLRKAFAEHELDNRDKHAIAAAMKGRKMSELLQVIEEFRTKKPPEKTGGEVVEQA